MRLHRLRLQNFRQHAATELTFAAGLTGIIGPNGAGKSTILEAIAWALYGNPAARGTKDTIRFARAEARARVEVELEFALAGHHYRVLRGLTTASVWLDDGATPVAESVRAVNEFLQRRLRMTRQEFFHTYFTGQKELDVMAAVGPTERARFLARVLGYDRLTIAQDLVREARRDADASARAVAGSLPDEVAVAARVASAEQACQLAERALLDATAAHAAAAAVLAEAEPAFREAEATRERRRTLDEAWRAATRERETLNAEAARLAQEAADLVEAERALPALDREIAELGDARARLAASDALARADAERRSLGERLASLREQESAMSERIDQLDTAPVLETTQRVEVEEARAVERAAATALEEARTRWTRDKQETDTRLEALRVQYQELHAQQRTLEGLGAESPCPTCGRPLGDQYRTVLDDVTARLETLGADGHYFRQRSEQLREVPEVVTSRERERERAQEVLAAAERRLARIQAAVQERAGLLAQRETLRGRITETETALQALRTGYDAAAHDRARRDVTTLAERERQRAAIAERVERAAAVRRRRETLTADANALAGRLASLEQERAALPGDDDAFATRRAAFDAARNESRRTELAAVAAEGERARAHAERDAAQRAAAERATLAARLQTLETVRAEHQELDRAFTELRTDLNAQLRPELAAIASDFLRALTDGRYGELDLDEQYVVRVLEDGVGKPVLSGGEEDLCNLVLRLAISQMIAERAGQAFSLLVLDEIFGSLDEGRRGNVVELLRGLQDRFEQVIVITHIDDVREGLDRVIVVGYDEEAGTSRVHVEEGTPPAAEPLVDAA